MADTGRKLGTLALDIVENFVASKLGDKFVVDLREDFQIAILQAMQATADRLWEQWADEPLWNAIFYDLPKNDELLTALKTAVRTFYEHPSNTHFAGVLRTILKEHGGFTQKAISKAVDEYITVITEEMALADESFRENMRGLTDLRTVEILKHIDQTLASQLPVPSHFPPSILNLHQLPPVPPDFIERPEELTALRLNIAEHKGALISELTGLGGIGKTVLGLVMAHELAVCRRTEYF